MLPPSHTEGIEAMFWGRKDVAAAMVAVVLFAFVALALSSH
jgi:hypothetical protein